MKVQLDYRTFIGMLPMGFSPSISSFFSTHFLVAIFYTFSLPYTKKSRDYNWRRLKRLL